MFKTDFLTALHACKLIQLTFYSQEDGGQITRRCAPMDYGPSKKYEDVHDRFHFWDYDSDSKRGPHTLSILPGQIVQLTVIPTQFDPAQFMKWTPNWIVSRNWGRFS